MPSTAKVVALAATLVALTAAVDDRFLLRVITLTLVWAAAGIAWNLIAKAGQISLAHSAFFGIGAYTFTILVRRNPPISPWIGMVVGMALSVALAVIIGLPTFRLKGFYFTLATIAFPLMLELLVAHFGKPEMTIPFKPDGGWAFLEFRDPKMYIWILIGFVVVFLTVTLIIDRAAFGFALAATRDNETLARAVGLRTGAWKMAAFAISAAMAAAVSVIWVKSVLRVTTAEETFSIDVVIVMLSVAAVGGVGRTWGPVLGSALLTPLALFLDRWIGASITGVKEMVYGLALVVVALFFPNGILAVTDRGAHRSMPLRSRAGRARVRPPADPPATSALLEVDSVAKSFGVIQVLSDVTFRVDRGERVGLIGPNGAGKTTLFNIVCGHVPAGRGSVVFAGDEITRLSAPRRYELGMARTFQIPQGFARMSVRDNVVVAALGARVAEPVAASMAALDRVGLADRAEAQLSTLTVAETKFLELARAVVSSPRLILLDEPLAGLNEQERRRFFETLGAVAGSDTGVLVIEHSVKSLVSFVNRLVALDRGEIIADGSPQAVIADDRVITSYLGERWRRHAPNP